MGLGNSPMDSHKTEQAIENVRFLESCGLHKSAIARRLGLTEGSIEKMLRRETSHDVKPGTLAYAQSVAEQHGDLEDAAVEDGMD